MNITYDPTQDKTLIGFRDYYQKPINLLIQDFLQKKISSTRLVLRFSAKLNKDILSVEKIIKDCEEKEAQQHALSDVELALLGDYYRFFNMNYIKAFHYYQQAAEKGNLDAINNMGWMYASATGVNENFKQAKECFERAAKAGHAGGLNNLGAMYHHGLGNETPEFEKAKTYYLQAAAQGHASALYNLGNMYFEGLGCPEIDFKQAKFYFEQATEQGSINALFNLAVIYHQGHGLEPDYGRAAEYYRQIYIMNDHSARDYLETLFNEQPTHPQVIYHVAMVVDNAMTRMALNTLANDHSDDFNCLVRKEDREQLNKMLDQKIKEQWTV